MYQNAYLTREGFDLLVDVSYKSIMIDQLKVSFHGIRYDFQHGRPVAPHMHDFFEFHYILSGKVKTSVNSVERVYNPHQYYIMTPLSVYSHAYFDPPDNTCASFAMRWKLERVEAEQNNPELDYVMYMLNTAQPLPVDDLHHSIANFMNRIIRSAAEQCTRTEQMIRLVDMIFAISRQYAAASNTARPQMGLPDAIPQILINSIAFIDEHYKQPISAADVAAHIPISYSHLARLFAKHMKTSINAYITRVRLDRASHLLMTTDLDISSIALEVGYASLSHFSNVFKKTFGQSPRDFRVRYKRKYFLGDPVGLL